MKLWLLHAKNPILANLVRSDSVWWIKLVWDSFLIYHFHLQDAIATWVFSGLILSWNQCGSGSDFFWNALICHCWGVFCLCFSFLFMYFYLFFQTELLLLCVSHLIEELINVLFALFTALLYTYSGMYTGYTSQSYS